MLPHACQFDPSLIMYGIRELNIARHSNAQTHLGFILWYQVNSVSTNHGAEEDGFMFNRGLVEPDGLVPQRSHRRPNVAKAHGRSP